MDENQGDQPLSSEELLRRAREGLGSTDAVPEQPEDFKVESSPPPVADPTPPPPPSFDPPEIETPAFEPEPPVFDAPPPSDPATWAPPPTSPDVPTDWRAGTPGPAPETVRKSGGGIFSKLWIVVVLIVGGFALFSFFDSSKTVDEIAVGDCFNTPEEDVFYEIDPIDCVEAHDLEVFALVDLSTLSSEFSSVAAYPGDDAVYEAAWNACSEKFEPYVGVDYQQSVLYIDAFTPTFEGWTEVDDRIANCVIFEVNDAQTAMTKTTGSLRNAGR